MFCRDSGVLCAVIGDLAFGENELVQQHAFRGNEGNASDFVPFALGFHHFAIETEQVSANQNNEEREKRFIIGWRCVDDSEALLLQRFCVFCVLLKGSKECLLSLLTTM